MKKTRVKEVEVTFTRKMTLEEKACRACGRAFWGARVKVYCSRACQNRANYERHAEQYRKERITRYREQKQKGKREKKREYRFLSDRLKER